MAKEQRTRGAFVTSPQGAQARELEQGEATSKPRGVHPGVAASRARPQRAIGVGVVYDKTGAPKIDPGFLEGLRPGQRVAVAADLARHGYTLAADNTVSKSE